MLPSSWNPQWPSDALVEPDLNQRLCYDNNKTFASFSHLSSLPPFPSKQKPLTASHSLLDHTPTGGGGILYEPQTCSLSCLG